MTSGDAPQLGDNGFIVLYFYMIRYATGINPALLAPAGFSTLGFTHCVISFSSVWRFNGCSGLEAVFGLTLPRPTYVHAITPDYSQLPLTVKC